MIHTAEEILRQFIPKDCIWDDEYNGLGEWKLTNTPSEYVRKAINEARIEAIKECAEVASNLLLEIEGVGLGVPEKITELLDQIK